MSVWPLVCVDIESYADSLHICLIELIKPNLKNADLGSVEFTGWLILSQNINNIQVQYLTDSIVRTVGRYKMRVLS